MSLASPPSGPSAPPEWDDPWKRWEALGREPDPPLSMAAVASLCCAIIGGPVLGLVFGVIALVRTRGDRRRGRGLAWSGLVISMLWVVVIGVVGFAYLGSRADRGADGTVTQAGAEDVFTLRTGDCLSQPQDSGSVTEVAAVPCTEPHRAQVYATVVSSATDFDEAAISDESNDLCLQAAEDALGDPEAYDIVFYKPTETSWTQQGDRTTVCLLSSDLPLYDSVVG